MLYEVITGFSLDAGKFRILADFPERIRTFRERIIGPVVQRNPAIPFTLDAGKHWLELIEKLPGPANGRALVKTVADQTAGVVNENSRLPRLRAGRITSYNVCYTKLLR